MFMKRKILLYVCLTALIFAAGCGKSTPAQTASSVDMNLTTVGFSQLGAESDWRSANTDSMKSTFTASNGYELFFEDGQQKQANQITAIRTFIQQEVDFIVLAPVTETGWDTVLSEAKDAGIPVIIVDRMVNVRDDSLFDCFVGSDFELEAKKMTSWMNDFFSMNDYDPSNINIVNIQGNLGASAQIGRTKGLEDACEKYGWNLLEEVPGEFTQAKGREVMEYFLATYPDINVVYCENDNEALGAIDAIEAAGLTVGSDIQNGEIMIVSFDGVGETARLYLESGKITATGECNPLHGPRVKALIEMLKLGMKPEKFSYVDESLYTTIDSINSIIVDGSVYPVTVIGK